QPVEPETCSTGLSHRNDSVRSDCNCAICRGRGRNVIVAAAVFVEQNDQQSAFPVWPVANGLIDLPYERFATMEVRWPIEFVQVGFRMHIVVRAPYDRIKIDRLEEGIVWKPILFRGRGEKIAEVGKVLA